VLASSKVERTLEQRLKARGQQKETNSRVQGTQGKLPDTASGRIQDTLSEDEDEEESRASAIKRRPEYPASQSKDKKKKRT
jgi:hypothetical protein